MESNINVVVGLSGVIKLLAGRSIVEHAYLQAQTFEFPEEIGDIKYLYDMLLISGEDNHEYTADYLEVFGID